MKLKIGVIYKTTYPNGKIYIGQDRTNDVNYFGSADSHTIAKDFPRKQRDDFTIRKQVLKRMRNVTIQRLNELERGYIRQFRSNEAKRGYNRVPGVARSKCTELRSGR